MSHIKVKVIYFKSYCGTQTQTHPQTVSTALPGRLKRSVIISEQVPVIASDLTVQPARVVLSSAQVLGRAHHPVDGRVTCREISYRSRVEIPV